MSQLLTIYRGSDLDDILVVARLFLQTKLRKWEL